MKLRSTLPLLLSLIALVPLSAAATPTLITTLDLSSFPSYGDGNVQTGISAALAAWNVINDPDLPTTGIGATPDIKLEQSNGDFPADTLSINLTLGGYNYIFFHWGGPNEDLVYANPQLYYVGGETGVHTFTAPVHHIPAEYFPVGHQKAGELKKAAEDKQYGLSFASLYGPTTSVPDGGTTLTLLGGALFGLGVLRRKFSA